MTVVYQFYPSVVAADRLMARVALRESKWDRFAKKGLGTFAKMRIRAGYKPAVRGPVTGSSRRGGASPS